MATSEFSSFRIITIFKSNVVLKKWQFKLNDCHSLIVTYCLCDTVSFSYCHSLIANILNHYFYMWRVFHDCLHDFYDNEIRQYIERANKCPYSWLIFHLIKDHTIKYFLWTQLNILDRAFRKNWKFREKLHHSCWTEF